MRYGVQAILPQYAAGNNRWIPTRYGNPIVAVVIHRMEGTLYGTDQWFRYYHESGWTSTHFGVGFMSVADAAAGRAQIRQWVDTLYTAWGWNARPTDDVPTELARTVFGPVGLYNPAQDMNRVVIHIETEGYADRPWHPAVTARVRELLGAIGRAHGALWVVAHTDLAAKPCPGLPTFHAALPGVHGSRLAGSGSLPDTSMDPGAIATKGDLPVSLAVPNPPRMVRVPAGTQLRRGPHFKSGVVRTTHAEPLRPLVGWTRGDLYKTPSGPSRRWSIVRLEGTGDAADQFDGVTVYFPRNLGDELELTVPSK